MTIEQVFVPASDESVDDEIQLHRDGKPTGVAVQISGGTFTAYQWLEAEQACWFGPTRKTRRTAIADALGRLGGLS